MVTKTVGELLSLFPELASTVRYSRRRTSELAPSPKVPEPEDVRDGSTSRSVCNCNLLIRDVVRV